MNWSRTAESCAQRRTTTVHIGSAHMSSFSIFSCVCPLYFIFFFSNENWKISNGRESRHLNTQN
jgi:hypothetical protein